MNYIELIEGALSFLFKLKGLSNKKIKQSLAEELPDNEVLKKLIDLFKSEDIQCSVEELPKPTDKNNGNARLYHFLHFEKLANHIRTEGKDIDKELRNYFFIRLDEQEQEVYKLILSSSFYTTPVKVEKKEQAE